ncbi:MAG: hypothetical protein AB2693_32400 [Candidatus Thiodiazotropha sp.]
MVLIADKSCCAKACWYIACGVIPIPGTLEKLPGPPGPALPGGTEREVKSGALGFKLLDIFGRVIGWLGVVYSSLCSDDKVASKPEFESGDIPDPDWLDLGELLGLWLCTDG